MGRETLGIGEFAEYFLDLSVLRAGQAVLRHDHPTLGPGWALFSSASSTSEARSKEEVEALLETVQGEPYAVGFLSYEAGPSMDTAIVAQAPEWPVLAWFATYDSPPRFYRELLPIYEPLTLILDEPEMSFEEYERAFTAVKKALENGESYQVNLTFRQRFRLGDEAWRFFVSRCGVRPPKYAAFLHGGDWQIASFSPELLFERTGAEIEMRPMKGTTPVPPSRDEIAARSAEMQADQKSVAENIMIVDMVRNDLGAIAEPGSVATPSLLSVERHRGLLQMTSTVTARSEATTADLLRHLFPAASITGAPKVATTRLIRDLELSPRHVYCGAVGVMTPTWQRFSVAIRTALLRDEEGEFGVGSGVVWDSEARAEYEEGLAKRDFLLAPGESWTLVESLPAHRLGDAEYVERHLARLRGQAQRFGIFLDEFAIREELAKIPLSPAHHRLKVRVAIRRDGAMRVTLGPSVVSTKTLRAEVSRRPVSRRDPNLRLKTSSRAVLDEHLDEHPSVDEVLLYNEEGLVTEFCRGNVVVRRAGHLYTPSPEQGCLEGIGVGDLVREGSVTYAALPLAELDQWEEVFFVNSVVGLVPVEREPLLASFLRS